MYNFSMRRLPGVLLALGAFTPAVLVMGMVQHVPASALHVPKVQIAAAGGHTVALTPEALGARRTDRGLQVRQATLDRTLLELAKSFTTPPRPGEYAMTPDGPVLDHGSPGTALDLDGARELLIRALRSPSGELMLPLKEIPAPAPPPYAIIVRLSEFRLDLYEGTRLRNRYLVGVGALRFPTPPGVYHIKSKAKNPSWNNPGSAWARGMPQHIGPGPKNPLGTRAMRLDRESLVIHGTPHESSVGHRASHGCMRMHKADVETLFDLVPTGTPVFIVP
jgi:lipoprotein-anchoring transpeptidase ErfK/SrfK